MSDSTPTTTDRVVRIDGKLYLVRNGEVFVKLRKWWSSGAVDPEVRATLLGA